jgi:hypothetical protein
MDIRVKRLSMLVVAAMMLFSVSCMIDLDDIDIGNAEIGELQETSEVVELDDADRVQVGCPYWGQVSFRSMAEPQSCWRRILPTTSLSGN